jgi:ribosome maturation factor RimP
VPATGKSAAHVRAHLLGVLTPVVAATGHDLDDVTVSAAGRRTRVRIVVDADGGVDLDAVAVVSRAVSEALEADAATDALIPGAYVLEVSSPGVDRPLTEPRHWRRAAGRVVQTQASGRTVTGRVLATSPAGVTLEVDGAAQDVEWSELGNGVVQVEFSHSEAEDE